MNAFRSSLLAIATTLTLQATASADPQVADITITFHTGVQVAATKGDARVYEVGAGSSARFTIVATYDDGSTRDVTSDLDTTIVSLSPLVLVDSPGEAAFGWVSRAEPAAFSVSIEGHEKLATFVVHP